MRTNIIDPGTEYLTYAIREIVAFGKELEGLGVSMAWENIGDPIAKGEPVPEWMKAIVAEAVHDDRTYCYSPTQGLDEARAFLARMRSEEQELTLTSECILFTNGLGDAIAKIYTHLPAEARIIGPTPAYPSHASAEAAHANAPHITYPLDPERNWRANLAALRRAVTETPHIAGILIINPDNPTGTVFSREALEEIVAIAREYDLFLIADEVYANLVFDGSMTPIADVLGDVPALVLRGLSKEFPWPGGRCGWIEVYNKGADADFARYVRALTDAKMLEVCATTLPQQVLPEVYGDERYTAYLAERREMYAERARIAADILSDVPGIMAPKARGAFYMSVVFEPNVLTDTQTLPIEDARVDARVREMASGAGRDARFVYYLMGAYGICTVPLSGFNADLPGFRFTLLEPDADRFRKRTTAMAEAIHHYLNS